MKKLVILTAAVVLTACAAVAGDTVDPATAAEALQDPSLMTNSMGMDTWMWVLLAGAAIWLIMENQPEP